MAKSEATNYGCFSGVLRRMLCTGNVPTHPSDNVADLIPNPTEFKSFQVKNPTKKPEVQAQTSPGVVARLMGLDSLPSDPKWVPNERARDSFSRSRSVNFAEYMLNFDVADAHHRRVRTSVSFRETPVSFQPQNREVLVVYLDDNVVDDDEYSNEKTTTKLEMGFGELNQGKVKQRSKKKSLEIKRDIQSSKAKNKKEENDNHKISRLKNEPRRKVLPQPSRKCNQKEAKLLDSVLPYKKVSQNDCSGAKSKALKTENRKKAPEKFAKKRKNPHATKKIQPVENNPENLVSDSFLDEVYDLLIQHDTLFSGEQLRPIKSNLMSEKPKDYSEINQRNLAEECVELAEQLGKLTEQDLTQSYWNSNSSSKNEIKLHFERFEEIGMDFEQPILDLLLNEVISDLVEISH
ncbi:uncharacterized protein LOC133801034 [Humulus lupulus]|uniref:uncharacterized protein LOC133801034 n=1 Tax=Humulus lupulus TaxID=3486 RepID=UPI002B402F58|nr:uncharacterized protein LOC133801034 [Humulus lupulus]